MTRPPFNLAAVESATIAGMRQRFETPPFDDAQFRDLLVRDGLEPVLDGISAVIVRAVPRLTCDQSLRDE